MPNLPVKSKADPHIARRPAVLRKARKLARAKLSCLLVSKPEDVSYLTGFSGEDSFLLVGDRWACLLTDGRYSEQAARECPGLEVHVRSGPMTEALAAGVKGRAVRSIGVQAEHLTLQWRDVLGRGLSTKKLTPVTGAVAALRLSKDEEEVRRIVRAVRVAEKAFRQMVSQGREGFVGRSERDVAAEMDYRMRLAGASEPAFETIVAAGAHASLPHYRPGAANIRPDQGVLIDWGAKVNGYCSDLTRVVYTGRIPPKMKEVHEVVARAQAAAISAVRPGVSCKSVDRAARDVIEDAGYGERFLHGLGHGVGREVHEGPVVSYRSKARLKAGMVITVEPGVYLPGVGGVRIEDDVLVTSDGRRRLSRLARTGNATRLQ